MSFCEFISDEIFVFNIVFNIVLYSTAICQESIVRWWRWWWWCFFINDDDDDYDNDDDDGDDDRAKGDMESQVQINLIIMDMIELQISIIELWLSIFGLSLWISIIVSWVAIMDCHNWTLVSIIEFTNIFTHNAIMDIHNCCELWISRIHILVFLFFGTPH